MFHKELLYRAVSRVKKPRTTTTVSILAQEPGNSWQQLLPLGLEREREETKTKCRGGKWGLEPRGRAA